MMLKDQPGAAGPFPLHPRSCCRSAQVPVVKCCSTGVGNPLCSKRWRCMASKCPRGALGVSWVCSQCFLRGCEALPAISHQVKGAEGSFPGGLKRTNFVRVALGGESNLTGKKGMASYPHNLSSIQYSLTKPLLRSDTVKRSPLSSGFSKDLCK